MASLYRRHPVGGLPVWVTEQANARGDYALAAGNVELILDGQQRVTSLHGIICGAPLPFFEGNADALPSPTSILTWPMKTSSYKDIHIHIEKVTGPDKNVDVVVEIFNKLNGGGTKLSKGDPALARICAEWTEVR
jgi:hypothetical protein